MDKEQFELVDRVLACVIRPPACVKESDGRVNAKTILDVGAQGDNLQLAAEVVGRRFGLRPDAVLGWYDETLNRQTGDRLT